MKIYQITSMNVRVGHKILVKEKVKEKVKSMNPRPGFQLFESTLFTFHMYLSIENIIE